MSVVLRGIPASPGIVSGPVHLLRWEVPDVPHRVIADDEIPGRDAVVVLTPLATGGAAGPAALLVDDICDQRQFVIKSLDTNFRAVDGVAGATILGDGQVALILDVDGLVGGAMGEPERQAA